MAGLNASQTPPLDDFSAEERRTLEEVGLFVAPVVGGKRKVSAAILSPPESGASGSVSGSSDSSGSIRHYSYNSAAERPIDLPVNTVSVAALELIGLTTHAATETYHNFMNRPDPQQNPDTLLDYILARASRLTSEPLRSMDDDDEAMTQIGISADTRRRILESRFTQLYLTETLTFWVKNTLRINYLTLEKLQSRLKSHAKHIRESKKSDRTSIHDTDCPDDASSSKATAVLSADSEDRNFPKTYNVVSTMPQPLKDHYILWKGKTGEEMNEIADWIQPDGSLEMHAIQTRDGGDFNYSPAWYWTEERDTAEQYRLWAARRCPMSETWLIRIQVPNKFMEKCTKASLWYGYDWKQYVWYCKSGRAPPEKYKDLWAGKTDIIQGHICTGFGKQLARIKQQDVQTKFTEDNLMTLDNRKCVQVVFMRPESVQELGRLIKGNVYVEIHKAEPAEEK